MYWDFCFLQQTNLQAFKQKTSILFKWWSNRNAGYVSAFWFLTVILNNFNTKWTRTLMYFNVINWPDKIVEMLDNYRRDFVISRTSCNDRVVWVHCEPHRAATGLTVGPSSTARCAAMRCIPWRCSVFSLGLPFFATHALLCSIAISCARVCFQCRTFRIQKHWW